MGRQYSTTTTFQDVLVRLKISFQWLKPEMVNRFIKKAKKIQGYDGINQGGREF